MRLSSVWLAKQYDLWLQMGLARKEVHGLKPHLRPYFLAVVSVGVTTLVRWLLDPIYGADHPLLLYYGALAVTAWYGGWWPALFSLLLSYLVADLLFIPPRYELSVLTLEPVHLLGCWSFLTTGILIAAFGEATKRAQHRAEYNARIAQERGRILEREITERKRAESQIEQASRELERRVNERTAELALANQELETFSHSVSHDLRSPLRSISSFTQMLKEQGEGKLDEEEKQMLQLVIQSARRMDELITDLLSLSRVSRSDLQRRPVNLSALVQRIATRVQATEPQHEAEFVIAPNLVAHGDERLLRIALENLLNNAWKFTGRCARGRIEFGAEQQAGRLVYFVRDNGAGFDMAHASQLFRTFQRLHSYADFPGTGIGLATVQRIINRHGGQIWAEGAVNQGATFYFTLPGGNC
jgi:K+-sensing histidine kinase KdpD